MMRHPNPFHLHAAPLSEAVSFALRIIHHGGSTVHAYDSAARRYGRRYGEVRDGVAMRETREWMGRAA